MRQRFTSAPFSLNHKTVLTSQTRYCPSQEVMLIECSTGKYHFLNFHLNSFGSGFVFHAEILFTQPYKDECWHQRFLAISTVINSMQQPVLCYVVSYAHTEKQAGKLSHCLCQGRTFFSFQVLLKMYFTSVLDCCSRGIFVSSMHWDGAFLLNDVFVLCSVSFKILNFLVWLIACSDIFWGICSFSWINKTLHLWVSCQMASSSKAAGAKDFLLSLFFSQCFWVS